MQEAVPFTRVGMIASIINWTAALAVIGFAATDDFTAATGWAMIALPVIVAALGISYRPRLIGAMLPATMLANALAGIAAVQICNRVLVLPEFGAATICFVSFFAFTIFRLLPAQAALAVVPYAVLNEWRLIGTFAGGQMTGGTLALYSWLGVAVFASGLMACATLDRITREGYRQKRIVDEQRKLIDRLQRAELQRQVAERARGLSEALSRLAAEPGSPGRLIAGDVVEGHYRVVRAIGAGGMGEVHEVERIADRERLALKVLRGATDRAALARFAREAQIAAELDHPNVVPALDIGVRGGTLFLVMPLITGGSLAGMRERYGDAAWARPILSQLGDALVAMHARGVVHRDLKPSNVLLEGSVVKVADFGIASLREPASPEADTALADGLTGTGAVMGTPFYMAPELVTGARHASPASDMFSLGVIAYELLAKQLPRVLPPRPLRELCPELAAELAAVVDRCLAGAPAERPTAAGFVAVLG